LKKTDYQFEVASEAYTMAEVIFVAGTEAE
jgi:hypothetical protein